MAECILWLWAILRDVWRNGIFLLHLDYFCEESSQVGLRVTNGIRKARLSSLSISSLVHFGNISNLLMIYCPLRKKSRLLSKLTVIFPPKKICHFSGGSPLGNISFWVYTWQLRKKLHHRIFDRVWVAAQKGIFHFECILATQEETARMFDRVWVAAQRGMIVFILISAGLVRPL